MEVVLFVVDLANGENWRVGGGGGVIRCPFMSPFVNFPNPNDPKKLILYKQELSNIMRSCGSCFNDFETKSLYLRTRWDPSTSW